MYALVMKCPFPAARSCTEPAATADAKVSHSVTASMADAGRKMANVSLQDCRAGRCEKARAGCRQTPAIAAAKTISMAVSAITWAVPHTSPVCPPILRMASWRTVPNASPAATSASSATIQDKKR